MSSKMPNIWEIAEGYVAGNIAETELNAILIEQSTEFKQEFDECVILLQNLTASQKQKDFRNMLVSIEQQEKKKATTSWTARTIPLRTHYLRTAGIAASIAILTTLSTTWIVTHNQKKNSSQYSLLKRELETIKRSQNVLIKNINSNQNPTPAQPANFSGTGFALTNDGYFITNFHVTEGADSVYIQNKEGQYFKANLVSFDAKNDIALLKVEDKNFKFSKSEVPYTIGANKKHLGSKVFTLGYPQDEIVYSEGYISAKNGFQGDSMQYRLDLPASPGQSGAPVVDERGNIIAVVTGKETESEGTTYAVGTNAVLKLIQSLPKSVKIKVAKSNKLVHFNREKQIETLEHFTCSVKVYKK